MTPELTGHHSLQNKVPNLAVMGSSLISILKSHTDLKCFRELGTMRKPLTTALVSESISGCYKDVSELISVGVVLAKLLCVSKWTMTYLNL